MLFERTTLFENDSKTIKISLVIYSVTIVRDVYHVKVNDKALILYHKTRTQHCF